MRSSSSVLTGRSVQSGSNPRHTPPAPALSNQLSPLSHARSPRRQVEMLLNSVYIDPPKAGGGFAHPPDEGALLGTRGWVRTRDPDASLPPTALSATQPSCPPSRRCSQPSSAGLATFPRAGRSSWCSRCSGTWVAPSSATSAATFGRSENGLGDGTTWEGGCGCAAGAGVRCGLQTATADSKLEKGF